MPLELGVADYWPGAGATQMITFITLKVKS